LPYVAETPGRRVSHAFHPQFGAPGSNSGEQ
jgi:hypothetical protein